MLFSPVLGEAVRGTTRQLSSADEEGLLDMICPYTVRGTMHPWIPCAL